MIREIYIYGPPSDSSLTPQLLYVRKRDERTYVGFSEVMNGLMKIMLDSEQNINNGYMTILDTHVYYLFEDGYGIAVTTKKSRLLSNMEDALERIKNLLFTYKTTGKVTNYSVGGNFDSDIEDIVGTLLKVVFLGAGGVGKTTLKDLLFGTIPWKHEPTMSNVAYTDEEQLLATCLGTKDSIVIWDIPGQERLRVLWKQSIKDADVIVIVTDSTLKNVLESAQFVRFCQENEPHASLIAIANKQDLSKSLLSSRVEQILKLKTYSMVAIDPKERDNFVKIIKSVVFGNGEKNDKTK